jgi:HEAT repeat protein
LAFYIECARAGTSEARTIALLGFKKLGPPAAEAAIPYLTEALSSTNASLRNRAVETLAELGPAAEELLRQAIRDTDEGVRQRATKALEALGS